MAARRDVVFMSASDCMLVTQAGSRTPLMDVERRVKLAGFSGRWCRSQPEVGEQRGGTRRGRRAMKGSSRLVTPGKDG